MLCYSSLWIELYMYSETHFKTTLELRPSRIKTTPELRLPVLIGLPKGPRQAALLGYTVFRVGSTSQHEISTLIFSSIQTANYPVILRPIADHTWPYEIFDQLWMHDAISLLASFGYLQNILPLRWFKIPLIKTTSDLRSFWPRWLQYMVCLLINKWHPLERTPL